MEPYRVCVREAFAMGVLTHVCTEYPGVSGVCSQQHLFQIVLVLFCFVHA